MQTRVIRKAEGGNSPKNARAEEIALALMGVTELPAAMVGETAIWDRTDAPTLVGRTAILDALRAVSPPVSITVTEVVSHGRAGTVSGRLTRDGQGTVLFAHILRFATASQKELAQMVSFEREERARG